MRTKPTALVCAAVLAAGTITAAAIAAPIPVAVYTFATQGDIDAFSKGAGAKCKKKLAKGQMAISVGKGTNHCTFRSSVVGDAGDTAPDTEVGATVTLGKKAPRKIQKKAFVAVGTRVSDSAGWELRIRPVAKTWQLLRDPAGSGGATVVRAGKGKFIRPIGKPNLILLRTFDFSSPTTQLTVGINGKTVASLTDAAADQPDGKRSVVVAGSKGRAAGTGITGIFDDVAIRVPNPF
ncbi:hypothetical protein BH20ACT15_BH20ACT15_14390 [soil metagenome]